MNNNNINQEDKRKLSQQRWRKKQKELIKKGDPVAIKRHEDRKAKNRISQQKWRKNIKKEKNISNDFLENNKSMNNNKVH